MADKRRRPPTDDSDDDDFGLRTPVKRPTSKHEKRPSKKVEKAAPKTEKKPDPEPEPEPEPAPPRKEASGKRKAVDPRPAATAGAGGGRSRGPVLVLAGAVLAAAIGGGVFVATSPTDEPPPQIGRATPAPAQPGPAPAPKVEPLRPGTVTPTVLPQPTPAQPAAASQPTAPAAKLEPETTKLTLDELRRRSADHEAIARLLDRYAELARVDPLSMHGPMFEDFRERERREQELLEELRRLGPGVIPALTEMLLELDHRANQLFMAKALAGMEGPEALGAVEKVLGQVKDVALQTTLVRFLPDSPKSAATVARAFEREENANLRSMLLREYARRLGEGDDSGRELFARAALEDKDPNVRAEAVTLIGRRGDPRDQALMEQIIRDEQNLPIRQRAIVSYAETGKEQSLPFLENLARDPNASLPIRASAVLAIGRIGGERAIQSLDLMAQTDPDQEIRLRAQRLAASLRARQQAERDGTAPSALETGTVIPEGSPLAR